MTPEELRTWMEGRYSIRGLAVELEISPTTVQALRNGKTRIRRWLVLALRGLDS